MSQSPHIRVALLASDLVHLNLVLKVLHDVPLRARHGEGHRDRVVLPRTMWKSQSQERIRRGDGRIAVRVGALLMRFDGEGRSSAGPEQNFILPRFL